MLKQLAESRQAGGVSDSDAALPIGGQLSWLPTNTLHMRKLKKKKKLVELKTNKILCHRDSRDFF